MSKYDSEGNIYIANVGRGSRAVVGAIGDGASGTVTDRRHTNRSKTSDDVVVGTIGNDSSGTVITNSADGDVIGAIGEGANGTVIIED